MVLILWASCGPAERATPNAEVDSFHELSYAQLFRIEEGDSIFKLSVLDANDGGHSIFEIEVPLQGLPARKWSTMSTTHLPYLKALACIDRVVAAAYLEHVLDSAILELVQNGSIAELSKGSGVDKEVLVSSDPEILLTYPFGNVSQGLENVFQGTYIPVTEYQESHPLGRAEWIKFFGVLTGKKEMADSIFMQIERRYVDARERMDNRSNKPTVFFGSFWNAEWHISGGRSYIARLIEDAGCTYWSTGDTGTANVSVGLEQLILHKKEIDFFGRILHSPQTPGLEDLLSTDQRIHELVLGQEMPIVYTNSAFDDVFGQGVLEPYIMLEDLHEVSAGGMGAKYFHLYQAK